MIWHRQVSCSYEVPFCNKGNYRNNCYHNAEKVFFKHGASYLSRVKKCNVVFCVGEVLIIRSFCGRSSYLVGGMYYFSLDLPS